MTRRKQHTRGRKVFASFWAAFLLIQLGAGLLLDYRFPQVRFPWAFDTIRRYKDVGQSPDVLCLGSSRIQSSVFAHEVNLAMRELLNDNSFVSFNANVPGGDLLTSEYVLHQLWERGARPKMLVLEVMPEEVNHLNDWLKLHVLRQIRWNDLPDCGMETIRCGHILRLLKARVVPLYTHRYEILKRAKRELDRVLPAEPVVAASPAPKKKSKATNWRELLASEKPITPAMKHETADGLHGVERGLRHYDTGGSSTRCMERILTFCEQQNVAVLMVGIPVTKPHRDLYTPEIEQKFLAYIKNLERTRNTPFVDCRHYVPDWMFRDNHHADAVGGHYFSQRFAREVLWKYWPELDKHVPHKVVAANR